MNIVFYLRSYDKNERVLKYDAASGAHRVMSRAEAEHAGLKKGFGAFVEEDGSVYGIFASPDGPVLFRNEQRVPVRLGATTARVVIDSDSRIHCFSVTDNGVHVFGTHYREREGLGANPYDQSPEDVDLFVMVTEGLKKPQFHANYTRPWP